MEWGATVQLVGTVAMSRLNAQYRQKAYATDVLSFRSPDVFFQQGQLGELVVCAPVLRRQAGEREHSEQKELAVLLVHGVLHLLGFDHELGAREARAMARWEARLLKGKRGLIQLA